ncbi:MAG: cupin domain-containing protein [Actinomycetota bacterium]|nr:cupin domain-containing protein [Actinomycetota bacterium]
MPSSHHVSPTEGDRADFPSLGTRYIVRSDQTDGRFALLEHTVPPRGLAAPVHTHENEDEYSYVLSGRMGAMVGDEVVEAGPGELVIKPRGIPHAFWNAGDEEVRLLELISPGGFDRYFTELAPLLSGEGQPDFEEMGALQARYGLTMDPETIGPLSERFGLRA